MECIQEAAQKMSIYQFVILLAITFCSGCDEAPLPPIDPPITSRPIATVYKVKADSGSGSVPCYRLRESGLSVLTKLKSDQLIEIVTIEEGLRPYKGELWLHVYPRLSHRPSCYVNVNNLIPHR